MTRLPTPSLAIASIALAALMAGNPGTSGALAQAAPGSPNYSSHAAAFFTGLVGGVQHVIERYMEPEDSWEQLLSSPERHNLLMLDGYANVAVARLVRDCSDDHGRPQPRTLELRLRDIWRAETSILRSVQSYRELLEERDIGESYPTEGTDVVYDSLGHGVLCMMDAHETWKNYVLDRHRGDVETLARIGSWQAKEWLGFEIESSCPRLSDQEMADRFFLGEATMFRRLKAGYGYV